MIKKRFLTLKYNCIFIIHGLKLGFNFGFNKKDFKYYKNEISQIYIFLKLDEKKLKCFSIPMDYEGFSYINKTIQDYLTKSKSIYFFNLIGLFCVTSILLDFNTEYINVKITGLIYVVYKLLNVLLELFSLFSRLLYTIKCNNSIYKALPKLGYKLGFLLGFFIFFILDLIKNVLSLLFQCVIFDVYLTNLDSSKSIGVKSYLDNLLKKESPKGLTFTRFGWLVLAYCL